MGKAVVFIKKYLYSIGVSPVGNTPPIKDLYHEAVLIAWPIITEGVLLSIIGSVDTMMVGTLGSSAIAAVGLTAQPWLILLILIQSLCVSTTVLVPRRKGENDRKAANDVFRQSMAVITAVSVFMSLLGFWGAERIMVFTGANEDTLSDRV